MRDALLAIDLDMAIAARARAVLRDAIDECAEGEGGFNAALLTILTE